MRPAVHFHAGVVALAGALALGGLAAPAAAKTADGPRIPPELMAKFKPYDSPYYTVYSDLEPEKVQLAIVRLTAVALEYHERTKGFAGQIKGKYPFFMIGDPKDYAAAGGEAYGVTWGDRLMGLASKEHEKDFWHVIQHEAFHQFAHNVISENLPGWVDEGMAEYFGESLWTGDGLVCGVMPEPRYKRFVPRAKEGKIKPFKDILLIKASAWAGIEDYDQALTMIHFCVHAQNGKYQNALSNCIRSAVSGATFDRAFAAGFGPNVDAIQQEYVAWWAAQPESIIEKPYTQAAVATLTSFLARAYGQGQRFENVDEFLQAARDGSLKKSVKQPLPAELLKEALDRAEKLKSWSLESPSKTAAPRLLLTQADGTVLAGSFTLKQGQVGKVKVDTKEPGKESAPPKGPPPKAAK